MTASVSLQTRNRQGTALKPERIAQLRAMVDDGVPIREIKLSLNMGHTTIKKYAPDAGWPPGAPAGIKKLKQLEKEVGL